MKWYHKVWNYLRSIFLNGLFSILPITLTIILLHSSFMLIKSWLRPILPFIPDWLKAIPHIEFFVMLAIILLVGAILRSLVLTTILKYIEELISNIPLIKPIYPSIKQLVKAFDTTKDKGTFKKVVMIEFPHKGAHAIGFLSGHIPQSLALGNDTYYTIFIPTAPNPTSGFCIIAREQDFKILDITRQEAMSFILSSGIVLPERLK